MTQVLVTGGNGALGREIVPKLIEAGYTARIMSCRPQPATWLPGAEWAQADLETGQGISAALSGIDVIVHAASSVTRHTRQVDVASRLCEIVPAGPGGRLPAIGGPQVHTFGELARTWLDIRGIQRAVIPLLLPGKVAQGFRRGYNTCPEHAMGKITWDEWVRQRYQHEKRPSSI